VELKLQVEELRQRVDDGREVRESRLGEGEVLPAARLPGSASALTTVGIEPREEQPAPNVVTLAPGMRMADIERAAIIAALRETRGNRRKAADQLGIGERTLYRKLKEYDIPET
jgi:DNA-binding NtrC family response regulator